MSFREFSFNVGISAHPGSVEEAAVEQELYKLYTAINALAYYLDLYTGMAPVIQADAPFSNPAVTSRLAPIGTMYLEVAEAGGVIIGDLLHVDSAGKAVLARSNAAHSLRCQLVALSIAGLGEYVKCTVGGVIDAYAGLTPGNYYYLSTTAGAVAAAAPGSGSNTIQLVGWALTSTKLFFLPSIEYGVSPP